MPKNPALVPTVVTDKNGRVTTVHRKPTNAKKTTRIPAPAAAKGAAKYKKLGLAALEAMEMNAPTDSHIVKNATYLAEREPRLLNDIVQRCSSCSDDEWLLWETQLGRRMFSETAGPMGNEYPLYELRARLELFDTAKELNSTQGPRFQSPAGIEYLMTKAAESSYENRDDWNFAKVRMVMNQFIEGDRNDIRNAVFNPEIFNRLPRLMEILPELGKRGSATEDTIVMLMNSDSGVLIDGEL